MEYSVEKISGNQVKLSFTATAEEFENALQKAYLKARGQIVVPGFRKGKAPRKVIERMYGSEVFFEDALDVIFPDAYEACVKENDLHPVDRPQMEGIEQMEVGKELKFSCTVFVVPDVELGEYKGVEVEKKVRKITAEEVDARIEHERTRVARSVEVTDRALENGDTAELDYSGSVNGKKFDGGTAEHQKLVIGSGSFIPGFEEQMVGMAIGEEKDLEVKFPEEYHSEELAGKDAVFHVKLHAITKEELPEIDDDFASEVSDFDTLAEYRADLEKKMQESADKQAENTAKDALVRKVAETAKIDLPDAMVEQKLDDMMQEMSWNMQSQGYTMEMFMKITGQTEAQMRDMYREQAKSDLKAELALDAVIKAEGIEAGEEEVDKKIGEYAASINSTVDKLKESENVVEYFKHSAAVEKALDLLWENAKVTEAEDEPAKPAEEAENK